MSPIPTSLLWFLLFLFSSQTSSKSLPSRLISAVTLSSVRLHLLQCILRGLCLCYKLCSELRSLNNKGDGEEGKDSLGEKYIFCAEYKKIFKERKAEKSKGEILKSNSIKQTVETYRHAGGVLSQTARGRLLSAPRHFLGSSRPALRFVSLPSLFTLFSLVTIKRQSFLWGFPQPEPTATTGINNLPGDWVMLLFTHELPEDGWRAHWVSH